MVDILQAVFALHGAVPMGAPLLYLVSLHSHMGSEPAGSSSISQRCIALATSPCNAGSRELGFRSPGAPPDTAVLMAASSARLAARHDFRSPFAAWLARRVSANTASGGQPAMEALRRYEVGRPPDRRCSVRRDGCDG